MASKVTETTEREFEAAGPWVPVTIPDPCDNAAGVAGMTAGGTARADGQEEWEGCGCAAEPLRAVAAVPDRHRRGRAARLHAWRARLARARAVCASWKGDVAAVALFTQQACQHAQIARRLWESGSDGQGNRG